MAITSRKLSTYAKDVKALSDTPNDDGLTAAQLKAVFMGAADEEIKTNHNGLIDDLVSKVDGSSGADNIGATAVKVGGSETVQGILEELKTEKVDAVVGKGLSTNDYDNTEKANVASNTSARHTHSNKALLDTYTQTEANLADAVTKKHTHANLTALNNVSGVNTGDQDLSGYALKTNVLEKTNTTAFTPTADHHPATKKYVDDTTPDVPYLSTINGVVTAIVDDDTKLPTSGAVVGYVAGLGGGNMLKATYDPTNKSADAFAMANMVEGTTNKIFTATERTKLSGIADNANNYSHPATHPASIIVQDANNRFMTDVERNKLAGIAAGANNYVHPTTAGNKHIPTGGTVGQILKNTASGTATWQNESVTTIANNLTETVAGKALDATQGKALSDIVSTKILKNWIINGGFDVWQRGVVNTTSAYNSVDRWFNGHDLSAKTVSRESFAIGQTDVPNNPTYFCRTSFTTANTASAYVMIRQLVEDVLKLSGKTITLTFWAKADVAKNISVEFIQNFGTGGSTRVDSIGVTLFALTTTWQRFSATVSLPSVSGKTIGIGNNTAVQFWYEAGSNFNSRTLSLGNQSGVVDISNVSLVEGSISQEKQTEKYAEVLFECQRYFTLRSTNSISEYDLIPTMRITPTITGAGAPYSYDAEL